jgi:hypothetical protein
MGTSDHEDFALAQGLHKALGSPILQIVSFEPVFHNNLKDNALVNRCIELPGRVCLCAGLELWIQRHGSITWTQCSHCGNDLEHGQQHPVQQMATYLPFHLACWVDECKYLEGQET